MVSTWRALWLSFGVVCWSALRWGSWLASGGQLYPSKPEQFPQLWSISPRPTPEPLPICGDLLPIFWGAAHLPAPHLCAHRWRGGSCLGGADLLNLNTSPDQTNADKKRGRAIGTPSTSQPFAFVRLFYAVLIR